MITANGNEDYTSIISDNHSVQSDLFTCEKITPDIFVHDQNSKDERQRQRREEAQTRTENLLSELRATREKVSMCP